MSRTAAAPPETVPTRPGPGEAGAPETLRPGASASGDVGPLEAFRRWPAGRPLVALMSGRHPLGRWSYLAEPTERVVLREADLPADDPLGPLAEAFGRPSPGGGRGGASAPFADGWVVGLSFELGRLLEPASEPAPGPGSQPGSGPAGRAVDPAAPMITLLRCPSVAAFDAEAGRWSRPPAGLGPAADDGFRVGPVRGIGAGAYAAGVRRCVGAIAAGEVYQVNLAHRLRAAFEGSARGAFAALFAAAEPCFGAYLEPEGPGAGSAVCSASPELFLEFDQRTRLVRTRPMKGTRAAAGDPAELRGAAKDRAELNMIVDLMRNDLGRVCRFGSVRVDRPRDIETHGSSVHQATATVSGELREGLGVVDLMRSAFPPGSVTGAPKIRATRVLGGLEAGDRGAYCGAIGWVDRSGSACFSVAIRTATIGPAGGGGDRARDQAGRELVYPVGAGIVADSDPDAEWAETLTKAEVIARAFGVDVSGHRA